MTDLAPRLQELEAEIQRASQPLVRLRAEVGRTVVGQGYMVERLIAGLIADGHVLLEGVPGLAKTTAVKTVAAAMQTGFARIQFTPDLLPADLLGTEIYRPQSGTFTIKKGPIFTNLLLADEINRAPAKVQSALLEAMQERQVTIGEQTFPLDDPFLVLATQNPIEQEGTYPLPEAQVDRFMFKLRVDYPSLDEEKQILRRMTGPKLAKPEAVISPAEVRTLRGLASAIYLDAKVEDYIVNVVFATRNPERFGLEKLTRLIDYGASPRATIYLAQAARVHALLAGRAFVTPQDVKTIGPDVLRHRVLVSYEAEAQDLTSDDLVREVFNTIDVP